MKKLMICLVAVMALLFCVSSCKPSLPSGVLSKGKMTDILYDYHLALAMAHMDDNGDKGQSLAYREAVLRKHDVTSAEFDSSMVYYMRHTELLEDVYKDLTDRYNNEITAMGGSAKEGGEFANLSATGDTANVWNLATSMVFMPVKPFNSTSFDIKVDSTFHKGDRLMLDFDAQFIYQDGMRNGVAMLAVQFGNDSIAQRTIMIQSTQHYSVELSDADSLGIKSVKGYFMLMNDDNGTGVSSQTTLKLMFLEHIKLIRMHPQKPVAAPAGSSPSASSDSLRKDSASSASSSSGEKPGEQTFEMSSQKPVHPIRMPDGKPLKPLREMKPMKAEPLKTR
ncbi:DUF4296 domain-containing protein [Prevotella sp. AM23-5]|jgi:hypothetical protein|uniref:DUF4296 domain-containing protein n=1 Tax=Prevotellaceae TaxID=171552 RepID=UPI000E46ED4D|nr:MULTISPECIES: DUF4296 domain-containing protein [Prevotellaceae]RHN98246.1 DUF4296 domain-containing protein [Prevotella sp. AM23-5]